MKMLRLVAAFAAFLAVQPAVAQWQTPDHSVPIGNGGGVTGFNSAVPGAAGSVFTSNGPTVDPSFQVPTVPGGGPQGRLTLISGDPWMTSGDAAGVQTIFLAPVDGAGNLPSAPIYNGTSVMQYPIAASLTDQVGNLSLALAGSANWPANTIFDVFLTLNGGVPVLATRAWDSAMLPAAPAQVANNTTITSGTTPVAWTNPGNAFNGTVHQTQANSAAITGNNSQANCIGQDFGAGNPKVLSQIILTGPTNNFLRGDGPTYLPIAAFGSNDNTNWTLVDQRSIDASTINTQYTLGINYSFTVPYRYVRECITGSGGSASIFVSQIQFMTTAGPSTRRLAQYGGMPVNDAVVTGARLTSTTTLNIPQYQGTYLGAFQTDPATPGQVSAYATPGPSRAYNLSNFYHPREISVCAVVPFTVTGVGPNNYTITSTSYAFAQGTSTYSFSALMGYAIGPLKVTWPRPAYMNSTGNGAGYGAGIGLDSNNNISGVEFTQTTDSTGQQQGMQGTASLNLRPFFGAHTFYGIEFLAYTPAGTLSVFTNVLNSQLCGSWKG